MLRMACKIADAVTGTTHRVSARVDLRTAKYRKCRASRFRKKSFAYHATAAQPTGHHEERLLLQPLSHALCQTHACTFLNAAGALNRFHDIKVGLALVSALLPKVNRVPRHTAVWMRATSTTRTYLTLVQPTFSAWLDAQLPLKRRERCSDTLLCASHERAATTYRTGCFSSTSQQDKRIKVRKAVCVIMGSCVIMG